MFCENAHVAIFKSSVSYLEHMQKKIIVVGDCVK